MVLSNADKREIIAMFEAFSERLTTGRQVKTAEEQALETLGRALAPTITGPRYVPLEEQAVGAVLETAFIPTRRKKAMTKFNRAVKKGMSIVKASTSYGKKGTISSPKKAFSAVAKTVSNVSRGKARPKKGILKKVAAAAAKLVQVGSFAPGKLPKRKKTRKDYRDYDPQGA